MTYRHMLVKVTRHALMIKTTKTTDNQCGTKNSLPAKEYTGILGYAQHHKVISRFLHLRGRGWKIRIII